MTEKERFIKQLSKLRYQLETATEAGELEKVERLEDDIAYYEMQLAAWDEVDYKQEAKSIKERLAKAYTNRETALLAADYAMVKLMDEAIMQLESDLKYAEFEASFNQFNK